MTRLVRPHYVGPNRLTRVPRNFLYLDTEAHQRIEGAREVQSFRCAVAANDRRRHNTDAWQKREWFRSTDTAELWAWLVSRCKAKCRTVLVAHNLAYDLRLSRAFEHLPDLGWSFKAGRVDDRGSWMMFTNQERSLWCVDTLSWVPTSLERLGELVELPKVALPDWEDDLADWYARCTRDVETLAAVWRRLMAWVVDDDLGEFKPSGAGQSWAAFRHRFKPDQLLAHGDDDAHQAERRAMHTGRTEAWRHGKLTGGPFTEWDFHCCYATIGRDCDVPTRLAGELTRTDYAWLEEPIAGRSVCCDITVETDVPVVPVRLVSGIAWPVGRFRTTVWDNEVRAARQAGANVVVERAWLYRTAPALQRFCAWVLDGLAGDRGDLDPVVAVALKHWSHTLIGRTAAQWSTWVPYGRLDTSDVSLATCYDRADDDTYEVLQLGGELHKCTGRPENADSMAAILSWVMAEARCRLWAVMQVAGLENVAYVDTDGLITSAAGSDRLELAGVAGLRRKTEYEAVEILGPRRLILGATLRASGVPRTAVRVAPREWDAEVWQGLRTALRSGTADQVEIAQRRFHLTSDDSRRKHLKAGRTAPFRVELAAV